MQMTDAAAAKTIAGDHAGLHLGGGEPAAVLRGVVHSEATPETLTGDGADRVDDRLLRVGVEVVHDEVDHARCAVASSDALERAGKRPRFSVLRGVRQP